FSALPRRAKAKSSAAAPLASQSFYSMTRRELLQRAGLLGLGLMLTDCGSSERVVTSTSTIRQPGSLPNPHLPEGTDTLPQIEHIIVVMMENHSFDNYLGMLGRGDGFRLRHGQPIATNDDDAGNPVTAFHMPSTCQLDAHP